VIGLLGSQCDVLGERMATGLNNTNLFDPNEPVNPDGYLITATGDRFQTSNGDLLVYVQFP
jgi:hypothetical protein